jgi:hypothetical protein
MAEIRDVETLFAEEPVASEFTPYVDYGKEADALNVYFRPDADYSKRLTDHITLFLSLETYEIVGCRIKGVAGILEDLPNYIDIDHGGVKLSILFWSFRGGIEDERIRQAFNELARQAGELTLETSA